MIKGVIYSLLFLFTPVLLIGQVKYPTDVEAVLKQTKTNGLELEKAISNFNKTADSLKLKAVYFLIANMDIQHAESYNWVDSAGKRIDFDELNYPNFKTSVEAFDSLKKRHPKLRTKRVFIRDIDTVKSSFLIESVNRAFELWRQPWAKHISFDDFCEYLLPYRISIEPLQNWHQPYKDKFGFVKDKAKGNFDSALFYLKTEINEWFTCTYNLEQRTEPLPRLGSLQLLSRKKGSCEDVGDMTTFALRSIGIPATVDVVPFWATSTGGHSLNAAFNAKGEATPYDILLLYDSLKNFIREPAKVLRTTYRKQANTLPYFTAKEKIPYGFLRLTNYKDVTDEYWPVKDVTCNLFNDTANEKIVYACVINGLKWQPTWWGLVQNNSVVFNKLCKGAVFLPMYYKRGKLIPAGYPVASGYNKTITLKPDVQTRTVILKEQDNYLHYQSGKKYKLFYWNNDWVLIEEKTAADKAVELTFDNVPKNALLLLVPEYSKRKERPFMITDEGQRFWW